MNLEDLQKNWDKFGKEDPLWAILTCSKKKGNKWDIDEFFNTGISEIDAVMNHVKSLDINVAKRRALDFGCGVGRLTRPLAKYFDEVYGVDIAPSMIELANQYNDRYVDKCRYCLNESDDLKLFGDNYFDFIHTNIVLQHMEPRYSKKYIKEFTRILAPDGILVFQLPSESSRALRVLKLIKKILPPVLLDSYRKLRWGRSAVAEMETYGVKKEEVVALLEQHGVKILDIVQDHHVTASWVSFRYYVKKNKNLVS